MPTITEIIADSVVIKNETTANANTATRVGTNLEELGTHLQGVETSLNTVETNLTTAESDINTLETNLATTNANLSTTDANLATAQTDITNLETNVSAIETNIDTVEADVVTIQSDITTIQTDITNLEASNDTKKSYVFNSSTEKVLPYLYDSVAWGQATKIPRVNFISLTDHNDETQAMVDVLEWVKSDTAIDKAITCALLQGDFLTSNRSNGTDLITLFNTWLSSIPNDTPILWCNGNHDLAEDDIQALADRPTNQVLRDSIHTPLYNRLPQTYKDAFTWGAPTDAMYYKCDIPDTNVRVIAMNQFEYPILAGANGRVLKYSGTGQYENNALTWGFNTYYSQAQIEFIISQLESVVANQTVILMTHISIGTESDANGDKNALADHNIKLRELIRAYNSHEVGSITFGAIDEIGAYTVNYDFSLHDNTWSNILNIRGHEHSFDYDTLPETIGTETTPSIQCMSIGTTSPYISISGDSISGYGADILSIKESTKELHVVRYGIRNTIAETGEPIGTDKHGFNFITNPITL